MERNLVEIGKKWGKKVRGTEDIFFLSSSEDHIQDRANDMR